MQSFTPTHSPNNACPEGHHNEEKEQSKSEGFDSCDRPSNLTQIGFKSLIFHPVWPKYSMDDFDKHLGASSRLHQALCFISKPSVDSNWSYNPETLNSGQNWRFSVPCGGWPWKFDGWPWKTIGHLFYATSSFLRNFIDIGQFKLELYSPETPNSGQNQRFFLSSVTLKFDGWPWKTIYTTSSFSHHFIAIGQFKL